MSGFAATAQLGGAMPEFDLCGPLPSGVTVLEASAGTGKTYTIAGLAARYVADGVPLERLLIVTFTRMATSELRERVRERLVSVERGLSEALAGIIPTAADPVVALLSEGAPEAVAVRRERLQRALANFDAATIATTHGFCQEVLSGLGIAGDIEPDVQFVESIDDLIDEVIDDLYVRRFARRGSGDSRPALDRNAAGVIARAAIRDPGAPIARAQGELAQMRVRLAEATRRELERRKHRLALLTFDDLLSRLDGALDGPNRALVVERLQERFDVVLIDEFQDTDPVQWRIMHRAFAGGDRTLVVIADPKQAIYAFRGADIYAYLEAASSASAHATLGVNRRSDQPLIDAFDALFDGVQLGHEGIVYRRVRAAPSHQHSRLQGAPASEALRIRLLPRSAGQIRLTPGGFAQATSAREHVARDVADDVVALLESGATLPSRSADGSPPAPTPVRPGHIAVLVRTNRNAELIRAELERAGVPAVTGGSGSVFATEAAREWLRLLAALERPGSPARAATASLTCFIGWTAAQLAEAAEGELAALHQRLHDWARVLRTGGIASLHQTLASEEHLPGRILAGSKGERRATDVTHVAELLHAAASDEGLGVAALTAWLRRRIAEAGRETVEDAQSRRLESDAEAVQVLTIHRSKGLEFPVVYVPFLWETARAPDDARPVVFHDPAHGDVRTVDVSLEGAAYRAHRDQQLVEQRGEELRLAYVALTRARHQAVLWWAGAWDSGNSPLGRLLFARDPDSGRIAPYGGRTPTDELARQRFEQLAARAPGRIAVEESRLGTPRSWGAPPAPPVTLANASFERPLDWWWRRTSYSDITQAAHEARGGEDLVASEPEDPVGLDDEPASGPPVPPVSAAPELPEMRLPSPLSAMGAGTAVGTLVHRVLEATDFAAADLPGELEQRLADALAFRSVDLGDRSAAIAGLAAAIETPLGALAGDRALRDLGRADRLDELAFELPLVGGDEPSGRLTVAAIARLLDERLPAGDPLAPYAARLADPSLRGVVRGYLTGSIDLVARLHGPRFAVVDYKTNWLAAPEEPLTLWHYRPEALAAEMLRSHYALQALLYSVALHRFLRWRLPSYDPGAHLAGVLYLFVRGMSGADAPRAGGREPYGVFGWRAPDGLVPALSDLLDRGEAG